MGSVKCKEVGCPHYITDPCYTVVNLFAMKYLLEETKSRTQTLIRRAQMNLLTSKAAAAVDEHLNEVDKRLNDIGLRNLEESYTNYKTRKSRGSQTRVARVFVLQCLAGHTYTYEVDCEE